MLRVLFLLVFVNSMIICDNKNHVLFICWQVNGLTEPVYSQVDSEHHFKYHIAVMRVMVQILVSMVDDQIIPYSLSGAVSELSAILWQTSEFLNECSQSMHDLGTWRNLILALKLF